MTLQQLAIILHASRHQSRRIAKRYCREFAGRANGNAAFLDSLLDNIVVGDYYGTISAMADEIEARARSLASAPDPADMAARLTRRSELTTDPESAALMAEAAAMLDDCRLRRRPLSDEILHGRGAECR